MVPFFKSWNEFSKHKSITIPTRKKLMPPTLNYSQLLLEIVNKFFLNKN